VQLQSPIRLPAFMPGMRIGLFGGSFDPPHEGHLMVAHLALRRLKLDRVWWLVSPQNPLKAASPSHGLAARMAGVARLADHPCFVVTGIEAAIGSRYTADTLAWLKPRMSGARLVWVMGADNMVNFHRWYGWRAIARMVPIAVIDRPESSVPALVSPAAHALARSRIRERGAAHLADMAPPAWVFLHGPRIPVSSTVLRNQGRRSRLESVKDTRIS
jgi:nicotinate-nucleotide adenylyltransferase